MKRFHKLLLVQLCIVLLAAAVFSKDKPADIAFSFPKGFLWGVSNSAQQVEGGLTNNSWAQWEKNGRVPPVGKAADFYNRYEEDIALAKSLHLNAFRFSIEWSRVEPQPGKFDKKEIEHYRKLIQAVRKSGMEPVVTFLHYTLPSWVLSLDADKTDVNGWNNEKTADAFAAYCGRMAKEYAGLADIYLTMNEPVVDLFAGYVMGIFPPGQILVEIQAATHVPLVTMLTAHAKAYHAIHKADTKDADKDGVAAKVSIAHSIMALYPYPPDSKKSIDATRRFSHFWNWMFVDALTQGKLDENADEKTDAENALWKNTLDFLGINFYNYEAVVSVRILRPVRGMPCVQNFLNLFPKGTNPFGCPPESKSVSEAPEGFYKVLTGAWERYKLPIFVTENGLVDEEGTLRPGYIVRNLISLHKALDAGVNIFGYLYWSLTDNYEWGLGYKMPFGLVKIDFNDTKLPRTMRNGSDVYGKIAENNGISSDLLSQYGDNKSP